MHAFIHTYVHVCIQTWNHAHADTHTCMYAFIYACIQTYTQVWIHRYRYTFVHLKTCAQTCPHVEHTHAHSHRETRTGHTGPDGGPCNCMPGYTSEGSACAQCVPGKFKSEPGSQVKARSIVHVCTREPCITIEFSLDTRWNCLEPVARETQVAYGHLWNYSLLHLECRFFNPQSQSMIKFCRTLLPRSVETRTRRSILEIEIK